MRKIAGVGAGKREAKQSKSKPKSFSEALGSARACNNQRRVAAASRTFVSWIMSTIKTKTNAKIKKKMLNNKHRMQKTTLCSYTEGHITRRKLPLFVMLTFALLRFSSFYLSLFLSLSFPVLCLLLCKLRFMMINPLVKISCTSFFL